MITKTIIQKKVNGKTYDAWKYPKTKRMSVVLTGLDEWKKSDA